MVWRKGSEEVDSIIFKVVRGTSLSVITPVLTKWGKRVVKY